jgi:signal recognition particle GTPase
MGGARRLPAARPSPVVVLLAGLQGAGKTTTAAKLARLLVSATASAWRWSAPTCAGRRHAAAGAPRRGSGPILARGCGARPRRVRKMLARAGAAFDVLIVDTAGRLRG